MCCTWCWPFTRKNENEVFIGFPIEDKFDGMFTTPLMNEILI